MLGYRRDLAVRAAESILSGRGWCVLEVCVDVPSQLWQARIVIFDLVAESVADAVQDELELEPMLDARLTGCDRRTLKPDPDLGAFLVYLAPTTPPADAPPAPARYPTPNRRRSPMLVRDGMNSIVVSVGPNHTLRETARRMTARGVGAAVVLSDEHPAPCIITERDILHSNGTGQDIDTELVRDHLTSEVVYASADWSLEQAAAAMVRGGFRHIIVLDGSEIAGILSMRDIVRCWTTDGAACEVGEIS
jgi:CBS domain-containing protein